MMFDIDEILRQKERDLARLEEIRRPINALYELIVQEGLSSEEVLSEHDIRIEFVDKSFDLKNQLKFRCNLYKTHPSIKNIASQLLTLSKREKNFHVCFVNEDGSGYLGVCESAESALSHALKGLIERLSPAIASNLNPKP